MIDRLLQFLSAFRASEDTYLRHCVIHFSTLPHTAQLLSQIPARYLGVRAFYDCYLGLPETQNDCVAVATTR